MGFEIIKDYWTMIVFVGGMIVMFAKMKSSSENNAKSVERLDAELEKTKDDVNNIGAKVNTLENHLARLDEAQKANYAQMRENDQQLFVRVNEASEAIATIKESVRCLEREKFSPKK